MSKRILLSVLGVLIISGCERGNDREVRTPVPAAQTNLRVPDPKFMGLLPLYIAEAEGFFAAEGISIQWIDVNDPGLAARVFFSGQADVLMSTFAGILPAEARDSGTVRLLMPTYESSEQPGSYILVPPGSSIKSLSELSGHTLGTYSGPTQRSYALMILDSLRLKERDVRIVQVASSAQIQGLFGGAYDALFTVEPYGSIAINQGARVLDEGSRTKFISNPFWVGAIALKTDWVKAHPQEIQGFWRAINRASRFIIANPARSREVLATRTGIDTAVANLSRLYVWAPCPTAEQLEQIQGNVTALASQGIVGRHLSVAPLFIEIGDCAAS